MDGPRTLRDALRRLLVAHGALDPVRRPCGTPLSAPHAWALLELAGGALTISALADRLQIDRTNVGRLCDRMVEAGELERVAHPHDGRARVLRLTGKGARLAAEVDRASAEHFGRVVRTLDAEEVVEALEALTAALRAARRQEAPGSASPDAASAPALPLDGQTP